MTLVAASDGHVARSIPPWSRQKLFYIDRYLDAFSRAMKGKWELVYADFFSGPGLCVDAGIRQEIEGTALLPFKYDPIRRVFLNDVDARATEALRARTWMQPEGRVRIETLDCNQAVRPARDFLVPTGANRRTLGVAVVDPTAFDLTYKALSEFTSGLRFDLIVIFMTGYVRRFIRSPQFGPVLDSFFGTPAWRALVKDQSEGERITFRKLLDLYQQQLMNLGYWYVNDRVRVGNTLGRTIYHVVFASKHEMGVQLWEKVSRMEYGGQRLLL